jgi:hypothetical protein
MLSSSFWLILQPAVVLSRSAQPSQNRPHATALHEAIEVPWSAAAMAAWCAKKP